MHAILLAATNINRCPFPSVKSSVPDKHPLLYFRHKAAAASGGNNAVTKPSYWSRTRASRCKLAVCLSAYQDNGHEEYCSRKISQT